MFLSKHQERASFSKVYIHSKVAVKTWRASACVSPGFAIKGCWLSALCGSFIGRSQRFVATILMETPSRMVWWAPEVQGSTQNPSWMKVGEPLQNAKGSTSKARSTGPPMVFWFCLFWMSNLKCPPPTRKAGYDAFELRPCERGHDR